MTETTTAQVQVPYVLNDPLSVAETALKAAGLSWQLFGSTRPPSFVRSTTPPPGHPVAKGTKIDLYCAHGPTP